MVYACSIIVSFPVWKLAVYCLTIYECTYVRMHSLCFQWLSFCNCVSCSLEVVGIIGVVPLVRIVVVRVCIPDACRVVCIQRISYISFDARSTTLYTTHTRYSTCCVGATVHHIQAIYHTEYVYTIHCKWAIQSACRLQLVLMCKELHVQ